MIGTTQFTNAIIEGRNLMPIAAVRLCLPATKTLPPMVGWPNSLRVALGDHVYLAHGGHQFDGRLISSLDGHELRRIAAEIRERDIQSVAISAVFSPVNTELEEQAALIFAEELGDVMISLSHRIGRIGLLERENATIVNACLRGLAVQIIQGFRRALSASGIQAPVYLSQNDGTLMSVDYAEHYPVATFASGPSNSMRGAAFLSGMTDGAVVDIGGTTSDIGMLHHGFPREASVTSEIGGVRTNFRMPDVLSIGLGGGSLVRTDGGVTVGPDSVGYKLGEQALVFGGDTLTATDIAVACGLAEIGDVERVSHLKRSFAETTIRLMEARIAEAVDRMKTSAAGIPLVVVGGGAVLIRTRPSGVSRLVRPDHSSVANAIGAAIAQVGGEVERVFSLEKVSREHALRHAKDEAMEKAIAAGATPSSVRIVDVEEVPLAYLPSSATRIKVKAVGDLEFGSALAGSSTTRI